jgi:4-amino-4-deoxy-L-arabinose transferase-like glycosyltransferase
LVLVAAWRLRPRGRLRDADSADVFLLAWALVPVLLFSIPATKLAAYVLPAFPAAALLVARAGSRGLLADRAGRAAFGIAWLTTAAAAGAGAVLLFGEGRLGRDWVRDLELGAPAAAGALALVAVVLLASLPRVTRADAARGCLALACAAGALLAGAFHAVAPAMPTLRAEGLLARSVGGARVVELSFKPSLFFYADAGAVYVAGVRGLVEPWVEASDARRLTLARADAVAMLREDVPTFALVDHRAAEALAGESGAAVVRRSRRYSFLANAAAQAGLGAAHASAE